jgi:hypothetical protein
VIRLTDLFHTIILESLATAKKRFLDKGLVDANEFETANKLDMTPTKKYIEKMLDLYVKGDSKDLKAIASTIMKFDDLLTKNKITGEKDIMKYKSLDDITKIIGSSETTTVEKEAEDLKRYGSQVIVDNEDLLVIIPREKKNSCRWGKDTDWCTTAAGADYYYRYTQEHGITLYYIFVKNPKLLNGIGKYGKMAVSVFPGGTKECFDKTDNDMKFSDVIKITGLKPEIFKPDPNKKDEMFEKLKEVDMSIDKLKQNSDGTYDYNGDIEIPYTFMGNSLEALPVKLRRVNGDFMCAYTTINTLKGGPKEVTGHFSCTNTDITSLEGSPEVVGGDFICDRNSQLSSLKGAPKIIGGSFTCQKTPKVSESEIKWAKQHIYPEYGFYFDEDN